MQSLKDIIENTFHHSLSGLGYAIIIGGKDFNHLEPLNGSNSDCQLLTKMLEDRTKLHVFPPIFDKNKAYIEQLFREHLDTIDSKFSPETASQTSSRSSVLPDTRDAMACQDAPFLFVHLATHGFLDQDGVQHIGASDSSPENKVGNMSVLSHLTEIFSGFMDFIR